MGAVAPSVKQFPVTNPSHNAANGLVYYATTGSNSADTVTITTVGMDHSYRVTYASAVYSGSPTQAGVTFTVDSALGAGYDSLVTTGSANAKTTVLTTQVPLVPGDAFIISVPAGGSGQTVGIYVVMEPI